MKERVHVQFRVTRRRKTSSLPSRLLLTAFASVIPRPEVWRVLSTADVRVVRQGLGFLISKYQT